MLHRVRRRFVAEDLESTAFEGVAGTASCAPQHASDAPASPPPAAAVAAEVTLTAVASAEVTPVVASAAGIPPAPLSLVAIVIDDSPPRFSPRAGGWERPTKVAKEGRPEKRPRVEVPPSLMLPLPTKEVPPSSLLVTWRPHIEDVLGTALVIKKCQVDMERSERMEARAAEWAAEKEKLREALEPKDGLIKEATSKSASSGQSGAAGNELALSHKANKELISQRYQARTQLEAALEGKEAELESALAKQKAELEEKSAAEFDAAMEEEAQGLAADYRAQLQQIRDRARVLGWKAALTKVGVPEDDPGFRNPP
ncbi:hypothetical protein MRB53_014025 [Persea americana]|uniref:Uncharacterized protein n=1 Tax=Persea americana TaxID=3435 RepID=A0ACC2K9Q1_PERAE|nr:hypothetical protein MRB53_014025 [Persea americana]